MSTIIGNPITVGGGVDSFNGRKGAVTPQTGDYTKGMVGLGNVDNTSDADKPISAATQTALNAKQATITGGASTIASNNLTASRALVSDGNGKVAASAVTSTELGYIDGVTSNVQTQLNGKQATVTGAATTITGSNLTTNRALISNASGKVAVSDVTSTELGYLDGVTSNVQTQINAKYTKPSSGIPKTDLASAVQTSLGKADNLYNNAGAHNSIYRGKNLGSSVTSAQYAAISAGTFDDMYIGDYWVINGVNWRIAAFDYYLTTGDTECNTHHVTIVPDTSLYWAKMNESDITTGGYVGSKMYTTNLATAKTTINNAFGSSHILSHTDQFVNAVTNGKPSGYSWYDSTVELMTEQNVYGGKIFGAGNDGSSVPALYTINKSQFPLFAHDPSMISNRQNFWLRDVVSSDWFAYVGRDGRATNRNAAESAGVRPAFSIKS